LDLLAEYLDDPNSQDQFFKEFSLFLSAMILKFKEQDQRARNLDVKLKEEQKQSEVLQKKLEELKTIEKTIMERGKGQPQ
jgi:predicted RNase H-like nuclease (RuvC/YqgF family)